MFDLKVCRICLCRGVKVYNYDQFHLKQYYEEVLASKVNYKDGLPHYFCYMCATMLYKFHKFKEKCHTGQKTLKEMLWSGPLTLSSMSQIDTKSKNLKTCIDIIYVSKRVKTYRIKRKPTSKSPSNESDTSLDNTNLAEIKKGLTNKDTDIMSNKEVKADIEKVCLDYKILPHDEDDRIYSDDDTYMNTGNVNDIEKAVVKEEVITCEVVAIAEKVKDTTVINMEIINDKTEQVKNVSVKSNSENKKVKKQRKRKENKDFDSEKVKKFVKPTSKRSFLDPKHWLKINLNEEEATEEFKARAQDPKYFAAAYKCTDCLRGFSKEDMLNRHNKLRHSESVGPILCRFCNMRFKWKCYLTRHITQHYTKYKCLRCDLMCPLKNTAIFHNDYHNGVIRNCMHCGEEFRHLSTYYTHLRTHRSEHVCTLCGASFVSVIGLNLHKRTMHVDTVMNPEEDENTYCERCDIKFETRSAYEQHLLHSAMHGVEDQANDIPVAALSIPKKLKKTPRRNPRKFTPCTKCNKTFSTQTAYMKHHKEAHKGEPLPWKDGGRHICEICGASLAAGSVPSHLNTHTREKLYPCATCGMQFKTKGSMTRHQLTHTGEKPFGCSLCDKRFTQLGSMRLHYRTFHLKEPYPKRNRRKKAGIPQEAAVSEEDYRIEDDSEENLNVDRWR